MNDLEKLKEFVSRNKVKAKKGFICVDGRYSDKYAGYLARPGGNFRGILVLLALRRKLGVTIGKLVDKVVDAVEEMGITFNMHTDDHHDSDVNLSDIGCGHIAKAEDPKTAKDYSVNPADVHKALVYLRIKLEGRKYYQMVELSGEHKEKGVIIVTGTKYTVKHWDKKMSLMFFVFDKARDDLYQRELFAQFKQKFPKLNFDEFVRISNKQLDATLNHLAKGLPIYSVNLDGKEPEIIPIGNV